jgi:hypothetical protein
MMGAVSSSEISVNIHQTTQCYIPEDSYLYSHRNIKSHDAYFPQKYFHIYSEDSRNYKLAITIFMVYINAELVSLPANDFNCLTVLRQLTIK